MEELKVLKQNAVEAYRKADSSGKSLLSNLLGKTFFITDMKEWEAYIIPRVNSLEDAFNEIGEDLDDPFFSEARSHENATRKIEVVAKALNGNRELSYSDPKTEKWRVWVIWDDKIAGFRFDGTYFDLTCTSAASGSRTAFASKKLAEHFASRFMPLINESLQ
jgi:hypothetical protein